ncbi:gamma subclass chorismate mutase AroQ [Geminicoccus roseus]|uniref:gamma subclass chorismate mutase AroQ n=1 Tax=Geminicoccus roseus TaxID=404900 RepID=UPI000416B36F|nr:gamma subclass chorismate mutase AroQ [Geminicoccus roseus]
MPPRASLRTAIIALAVLASLLPAAGRAEAPVEALREAMVLRLEAMPDVARHKWNNGSPVEDLPREQVVIEAAVREGEGLGLADSVVRPAVAAQIEAAKAVQAALIVRWTAEESGPFAGVPDLASVLRPQVQEATSAFLRALAGALADLRECAAVLELRALPPALSDHPEAWRIAAEGVLAAAQGAAAPACSP